MALTTLSHGQYEPPSVLISSPILCATCEQVWDSEDQEDEYTEIDGKHYCNGPCADEQNRRGFRAEALGSCLIGLDQTRKMLEGDQVSYPCEIDEPGNPFELLDDFNERIAKFALGKDTGFRNDGAMLDYSEFRNLLDTLRVASAVLLKEPAYNNGPTHQAITAQITMLLKANHRTLYGGE